MADQSNPFSDPSFGATPDTKSNPFSNPEFGKPASAIRKLGDLGLGFASGAVGATKALADVAGADNKASRVLGEINTGINDYLSPAAKADQQEQGAIMAGATGKGVWEGVKAGVKAFGVAPVQTAVQGLGSVVPIIAGTALTGGVLPTAAAGAGIGVAMGAGTAKGAIFDEVKKRGIDKGLTEAQATAEADAAQSYGGANTDQIALGGALGAADALTGVSAGATRMARNALGKPVVQAVTNAAEAGVIKRAGMGMLKEMPLEAAQGGQEQVAANVAAQRAGYEAGTWDNVASNATLEALASAGPGAAFGALETHAKQTPPPVVPPAIDQLGRLPPTAPTYTPAPSLTGTNPADLMGSPMGGMTTGSANTDFLTGARDANSSGMGYNPDAGKMTQFPDGSQSFASEVPPVVPVKPSEAMGINPTAGPISAAAALSVDTGITQDIQANEANAADQAAYEQATQAQAEQQAEQDTADKPITTGKLAEAQMSEEDKRAILFSNKAVADGGIQYTGTQDGDILNGMGAPFATRLGAQRRVRMEGSDWTVAPVFDGFVARRKDAMPAENNTPTASVGGNIATPAEPEKQPNPPLAAESIAPVATESVAPEKPNGGMDYLMSLEADAGQGFKSNDAAIDIIKDATQGMTPVAKAAVTKVINQFTSVQKDGTRLIKPDFYEEVSAKFAYVEYMLSDAVKRAANTTVAETGISVSENAAPVSQWNPSDAVSKMGRSEFVDSAVGALKAKRESGGKVAFSASGVNSELTFRQEAGIAWDAANTKTPPAPVTQPAQPVNQSDQQSGARVQFFQPPTEKHKKGILYTGEIVTRGGKQVVTLDKDSPSFAAGVREVTYRENGGWEPAQPVTGEGAGGSQPTQVAATPISRADIPNEDKPDATPEQVDAEMEAQYQQSIKESIQVRLGLVKPTETDAKKTPFKTFLRQYGIAPVHTSDIAGKNRFKANNMLPATFRAGGLDLDSLVERAIERGFMTEADRGDQGKLISMIQSEIAGDAQVSTEFADDDAAAQTERMQRMEIEGQADKLGLPYSADTSTDQLASTVNRVQRRMEKEVGVSFNGRGSLKSERVLANAREVAARIERKRAQYRREMAAFDQATIAEQDALLDLYTDEDGNPVIVRVSDMRATDAWFEENQQWDNGNETDTRANQDSGQAGPPVTGVSQESAGDGDQGRSEAQPGSTEVPAGQPEGLTATTPEQVKADEERATQAEKVAKTKKRADDELARKAQERKDIAARSESAADSFVLGGDAMQNLSGQGSMFDMPAEPEARSETPSTYINGDRAEYTGKTEVISGGKFYEVKFTEGRKQGETAVTQRAPDGTGLPDNAPKASGLIAPQLSGNPGKFIKIAADSIDKLRKADVERVLTETPAPFVDEVAGFIREKRKDLAQEVDEALAEQAVIASRIKNGASGQKGEDSANIRGAAKPEAAPKTEAAPAARIQSADELRAQADLMAALADLGDIFGKNTRMNMLPEQEAKILPVMVRLFDAAFRLGYHKFMDAAKFTLDKIRAAMGNDVADDITLEHLQGAYISMSSGKNGVDGIRAVSNIEAKTEVEAHTAQTDNERNGETDAPSTNASVERDSPVPSTEPTVGDSIQDDPTGATGRAGEAGGRATRGTGRGQQNGPGVSTGGATAGGERGNQRLPATGEQSELTSIVTGADFSEPGGDSGITGVPAEPITASQVDAVADQRAPGLKNTVERNKANKAPVVLSDLDSIKATLPQLLPGQQEDVKLAETRFAKEDGYGMLFTNGTGTGKTFSGLGIIKRHALQGKTNTLIVAPDSKIASDWMESGKLLGLDITLLDDTKDAGKGIVITTYANLGANDKLAARQWDLVVADEAHSLMQAADGEATGYLQNLRAITYHPDGAGQRHSMLNRAKLDHAHELGLKIESLERMMADQGATNEQLATWDAQSEAAQKELGDLRKELDASQKAMRAEVDAKQGVGRTRLVALSATPFAYEKTIDWANGYLFNYNEGQTSDKNEFRGYNQGSNKDRYMMLHFGYSMRYNKMTRPDANVDSGLMQRQWNGNLKKSGALSGRMLDVVPDYDRRFILVDSAIGNRIDEALEWISEQRQAEKGQGPYQVLGDAINEQFKYQAKRYLLEAIKADAAIPIVKAHMAMGRKVVVFHDYKKGGGFNPFRINSSDSAIKSALSAFNDKFKDLVNHPFEDMPSPIDLFSREIPGVLLINGDEKKADLLKRYKSFQDDANGPQVMLVQSAKNKGWSGHDTTGKHQRVLINLGQPTAPTLAIQQEGRIYRTGQASDAVMRYMNTGTNWERWTFASTIATRASTAENLGMGEMARALKDSFIQSFEESDTYEPGHEGEGKGGKERDKAANDAVTEYDRAKTFYFGQQKKNSRTKAQEGADYFATPEPIGLKMVQWLDARGGESVMEPSAGHGAISRWLPDNTMRTAIEPSFALRSKLALVMEMKETGDRIIGGTFEDHHVSNKYDGIVMNPPFGTAGRTAVDHLAKAATHLRDGGRIVALLPDGPSANAKFDKWFYESSERPAKHLQVRTGDLKVYAGDTIIFEGKRFIATATGRYPKSSISSDYVTDGVTKAPHGSYIVEPGTRTESFKPAEGLSLVASIKLPTITFERAGTAVATRIVVIEKNGANVMERQRDFSDITDIKELFDKLENLDFAARVKPVEVAPAEPVKAEKPASTPKPAKATASAGDEVSIGGTKYEVEIYTTNAGKEKRGVWMASKAEAMKYSARTFTHSSNKGKWFVDEYWFPKDAEVIKPDSAFSRSAKPTRGLPTAQVTSIVDAIRARWGNAPEIIIASDMSDPLIPQKVRNQDQMQKSQGATGEPEGFVYRGKVYILASEMATPSDVMRVLFHESLGHLGLRGVFGDKLKPILQQLAALRRGDVAAKAKQYGLDMNTESGRLEAAEEVLAEMAQTKPEIGFVKRAIALIRGWLRANVPGFSSMKLTDADIITNFILPARRFVEGKGGPTGGKKAPAGGNIATQPAFSRSLGATLTDAANNVRGVKLAAGYEVGDLINGVPGKLNWWHRTVGTQYNLAQRSKPFKRVFDSVQNFIGDVSYFASEAADLAPNILPKLENLKDIGKSPLSADDTKAISAPIFEGTLTWGRDESGKPVKMEVLEAAAAKLTTDQKSQRLLRGNHLTAGVLKMWRGLPIDQYTALIDGKYESDMLKAGVVWTDAELKSLFNLTDKQIPLYREFRAATDKSLTNLAIADMLRFAGKDAEPIREAVLDAKTPKEAADTLAEYLRSLASADGERSDVLMDTADKVIGKGDKAQDLMDRGYAPLSRFGKYTLDVVDENGDRVYFGMFENRFDAAKMNRQMQASFPGATINQGTVSEQAYTLFAGVTPETLELFGDMLGLESTGDGAANEAFQTYLKLAKSSRSAMKRLIQRKGIAGFSEDAGRVLAGFIYSNARQTSSSLHMGEMTQAATDKDAFKNQGELQDAAAKLVDYIKNPQEEAQAFRGLLFAQYIGGSIASAMVNMTQPITMTLPWLAQFGGITNAAKQMANAVKDANKPLTGNAKLDAALKRAEEDGTVSPQEVHQLMQQAQGRGTLRSGDGTMAGNSLATANNTLSRVMLAWGKPFSWAEQFNRRSTFIAAYRTAVAQGMTDPDAFARRAISETQGVYNKGNKPAWARGAVGSILFTFKQYSISYVEMLQRMSKNGPEGKKAALLALGILFLMSGAGGMPGADDLDDLISGALQTMGYNFDSRTKRQAFFAEMFGQGGAQFLERGISGLPGTPIDVSGRMGMGNLIPGTGLFTKKVDHTRDVAELVGPAGDLVKRGFEASAKVLKGEVSGINGAAATISPKAAQNLHKAFDMFNMGMYRDSKGAKVLDTDMTDAVMKGIGFQPNDVKKVQDASFEVQRMIGLNKLTESELSARWALGLFEKDSDKVQAARDDLAEWNRANPESPIRIKFGQVLQRVKKMNESKETRMIKTAPKEIRNAVRAELEASR